jgi:hypothetical protein
MVTLDAEQAQSISRVEWCEKRVDGEVELEDCLVLGSREGFGVVNEVSEGIVGAVAPR